jgi:hypothetical protein
MCDLAPSLCAPRALRVQDRPRDAAAQVVSAAAREGEGQGGHKGRKAPERVGSPSHIESGRRIKGMTHIGFVFASPHVWTARWVAGSSPGNDRKQAPPPLPAAMARGACET